MSRPIPPPPSEEQQATAFGAQGNPTPRSRPGADPTTEPPVGKVRDVHGRLVSKKRANAPFLAYAKYKEEVAEKERAKALRMKEREEKIARGEPVGPIDYEDEEESAAWALFKVFVVCLGFILIAGRFVTGSFTFGYKGKWVQPRTYWPATVKTFTESDLAKYDGSDPKLPIYLAIDSEVYDVSASPRIYGPGGSYAHFAGIDGARAFSTGCFKIHRTHDLRGLNEEQLKAVQHWKDFFTNSEKYFHVGKVTHPPIDPNSPLPPECDAHGNAIPAEPRDLHHWKERGMTEGAAGTHHGEL